jgi:hypothetical protein
MRYEEFISLLDVDREWIGNCTATCPAHDDHSPSLSVGDGSDKILLYCHAGCTVDQICDSLGLTVQDLFYDTKETNVNEPEAIYRYLDEEGKHLYDQVKFPGKQFRFRRITDNGWVWGLMGSRKILYNLFGLVKYKGFYDVVLIVDGEKDANRARNLGYMATCAPGGMNKWAPGYVKFFIDQDVIIVKDRDSDDTAEKDHNAAEIVRDSLEGIARKVRVVQAKEGKDLSDHLDAGYSIDELEEL